MKLRYDKNTELFEIIESTRIEFHQTKQFLTRFAKNYMFSPRYKMKIWDGKSTLFKNGKFALGLWKDVHELSKLNNWKFEIENKSDIPVDKDIKYEDVENFCKEFFKYHKGKNDGVFYPYDHQIRSVYNILRYKFCLTEVATGGGKSFIFGIIAFYILKHINPDAKFLLIVPSISLVTQFYNDIKNYNNGFNNENKYPLDIRIHEIMSDKPRVDSDDCNIYIGTYQSLEKYPKEFFEKFYCVTTDEAHKSGAKNDGKLTFKQIEKVIKKTFGYASYRFGMSGTFPKNDTLDWIQICSLHGPKIAEVKAKELMDKNVLTNVKIKALLLNYDEEEFNDTLNIIKTGGNGRGAFELERKYIHESNARLDFIINKIISRFKNNSLVLFNIIEYGEKIYERLRELENFDVYYIDGNVKKDKRSYIINKLDSKGIRSKIGMILKDDTIKDYPKILVASSGTLSTGISINNLHYLVFMENYKSEQVVIQSIGRILRLFADKTQAIVFDVVDIFNSKSYKKNVLRKHYETRKEYYFEREYPVDELKVNLKHDNY